MTYVPRIVSAEPVARYEVAGRQAVLLGNVVSAGMVQYLYVLVVYEQDGERFAERLRGMFAVAIWDVGRRRSRREL